MHSASREALLFGGLTTLHQTPVVNRWLRPWVQECLYISLRVGAKVGWADVAGYFSGPTHCTRRVQRRASGTECQVEVIITPVP